MKKILYIYGGMEVHPTEQAGHVLAAMLATEGVFTLDMTDDLAALCELASGDYAAVVDFTTRRTDDLLPEYEKALLDFVRNGGGFVALHSAIGSFRASRAYIDMVGGEFLSHPAPQEFAVSIVNHAHEITRGLTDYTITDEIFLLQNFQPDVCSVLTEMTWEGEKRPMAFVRAYGRGRVAYVAHGHDLHSWAHPVFRTLVTRAITWVVGA